MGSTLRGLILKLLPISLALILIAIIFNLIGLSARPEQSILINEWLFPLTVITIALMFAMVIGYTIVIIRRLRAKETGSHYTLRLMLAFSSFTIFPLLIVSYFSFMFIGDRIDDWFRIDVEGALEDSIELSERSLKTGMGLNLRDLKRVARFLLTIDKEDFQKHVEMVRPELKAYEIVVLSTDKRVLAYSTDSIDKVIPRFPRDEIYQTLSNRGYFIQMEPDREDGLYSRVALTMRANQFSEKYILTALFPISQRFSDLGKSVQVTRDQYKNIKYQRKNLKSAFLLSLLIIIMLSILFSLWAAFLYTQRLTAPVKLLVDGTLAVANGDLNKKIPVYTKDDFSLLARSFNTMTTRLSDAQKENEESRKKITNQNDYLNTVLNHLNSGVVTLDNHLIIHRINKAAANLLDVKATTIIGQHLPDLFNLSDTMPYFIEGVISKLNKKSQTERYEWKGEITILDKQRKRTFMSQGVEMNQLLNGTHGFLIVFDDITDLIEAEHEAAWGEVARRLAHEIKNPLTPIQLSAERLQFRLTSELNGQSADLLQRMTKTIINQVDSLKTMVNAFSDYAKLPTMNIHPYNINYLIREVVELYRENEQHITIQIELNEIPNLLIDPNRIRQVFINLIKNSLEAFEQKQENMPERFEKEAPILLIYSYLQEDNESQQQYAMIQIIDNGIGFQDKLLPTIFEPYITSKIKGTGLGLSIVKKIIEEHSGTIMAQNNSQSGASIEIKLPITKQPKLLQKD